MFSALHRVRSSGSTIPRYPESPDETPPAFRGQPTLRDDACRGSGACALACPTGALTVRSHADGWTWRLDRAGCTGCGVCIDACPSTALEASRAFELAARTREDLLVEVAFRQVEPFATAPLAGSER